MMKKGRFYNFCMIYVFLLLLGLVWFPSPALAQPPETPGQIISPGMAPFTETWAEMQKRDAAHKAAIEAGIQPPPPRVRLGSPRPPIHKRTAPGALAPLAPAVEQPLLPSGPRPFGTGAPAPSAPQAIGVSFAGVNMLDSGFYPPDTMGAVGYDHFVEVINGAVAIYNKSNGTRLSLVNLDNFFWIDANNNGIFDPTEHPINGAFDPRVLFDKESDRWFAIALEFGIGKVENHIILAVSQTNNPTGTWDKYVIPVGEASSLTDFDTLGVDSNGVYFGMTMFPGGSKIAATAKASLLYDLVLNPSPSLGPVTAWNNITDMYSSPQPAHNHDVLAPSDPSAPAWFVSSSNTAWGNVNYRTLTWGVGGPTLTPPPSNPVSVVITPAYNGNPYGDYLAPAQGSTIDIEAGDDRLQMAVIRNNRLWTARNVGVNSSGGPNDWDRTGVEWLELNVSTASASYVQSGRVYDSAASNPFFYYYPSLMVNAAGEVAMGFSGSSNANWIGAYTCGRFAGDPLNTMGAVALIKDGEADYNRVSGGRNRWGDYSYTSLDPVDDLTFWTIQEYATNIETNRWGTWVAQLLSEVSTPTTPTGTTFGIINQSYDYTTGGSISNKGHQVEYRFDWGDGNPFSPWGAATQSHTFAAGGTFSVKSQARCTIDTAAVSAWSSGLSVGIETISTPNTPTGTILGLLNRQYAYTTGGGASNLGHAIEYQFTWGDGNVSPWGAATQNHAYTTASIFLVTVQARCTLHPGALSAASAALTVNISDLSITNLQINGGATYTTNPLVILTYTTTGGSPTHIRTSTGASWSSWRTLPVTPPHTLSLGFGSGQREVYAQVKDAQGRVSDVARANIILDTANPTGVVKLNGGAYSVLFNPAGTTVRLHLAMFDANMTGALVRIKQDVTFSGDPDPAAPWKTFNFTGRDFNYTTTGSKKIYVQFKDGAGRNSSVYSASINISTTGAAWPGPSAVVLSALALNGGALYTTTTAVTFTYNTSLTTGIQVRYLTSTAWTAWETPAPAGSTITKSLTLPSTNGPRLVYVQLKENASGKMTDPQSAGIILDTTAPNGAIQINNGDMSVTQTDATTNVTLTIVASDTASGIDQIYYDQTGVAPGAFVPFTPTVNNFPLDTAATGTKYVYIWFKDKAGKVSTRKSDSISVMP